MARKYVPEFLKSVLTGKYFIIKRDGTKKFVMTVGGSEFFPMALSYVNDKERQLMVTVSARRIR
jgi:hypothetical protein